jgi:hypothetical protein
MSRRSFFLTVTSTVLVLVILSLLTVGLLRHESRWYQHASLPPGAERQQYAKDCMKEMTDLFNQINGGEAKWACQFTDYQLNSLFEDGIRQSGLQSILPEDMTDIRFAFAQDRLRFAFRYGHGLFSTVIQTNLRIWKASQEPNVLVLELEGLYAGALPFAGRSLLEKLSEIGRQNNIGVNWFRNQKTGNAVAVLRFQDNLPRPTMEIDAIQLSQGSIHVSGHFIDSSGGPHAP